MKKYTGTKGKLDRLVGDYFRARPCDRCNKNAPNVQIQWAHIKSRQYLSVRWLLENGLSLCARCHFWAHNNPDAFVKWIEAKWPGRLEILQAAFTSTSGSLKPWWYEDLYGRIKLLIARLSRKGVK